MERYLSVLGERRKTERTHTLVFSPSAPMFQRTRFTAAPVAWITLVRDRLHITYRVN